MSRYHAIVVATALVVGSSLLAGLSPAQAGAGSLRVTEPSVSLPDGSSPWIAVRPDGGATLTWRDGDAITGIVRSPGRRDWTKPASVAIPRLSFVLSPRAAAASLSGGVTCTSYTTSTGGVGVVRVRPNGQLINTPIPGGVSSTTAAMTYVVSAPEGCVLVWRGATSLRSALISPTGTVTRLTLPSGTTATTAFAVASDGRGRGLLVADTRILRFSRLTWSTVATLPGPALEVYRPSLAPDGTAAIPRYRSPGVSVQMGSIDDPDAWTDPIPVTDAGERVGDLGVIALNGGRAVALWVADADGLNLFASRWSPVDSEWSPVLNLGPANGTISGVSLGNRGLVTWPSQNADGYPLLSVASWGLSGRPTVVTSKATEALGRMSGTSAGVAPSGRLTTVVTLYPNAALPRPLVLATALVAPYLDAPATLSSSTPRRGTAVTCRVRWVDAASTRYVWLRNGRVIAGAASASYTPVTADRGAKLACRAVARNPVGSRVSTSRPSAIVR